MTALAVPPLCSVARAQGWQAARAAVHRHAPGALCTPAMLHGSFWMYISLVKWWKVKGCINHDLKGWEWECGPQSINIKITELLIPGLVEVAQCPFSSVTATKGGMKYLTTMRMVWSAETCITPCSSGGSCRLTGQGRKGLSLAFLLGLVWWGFFVCFCFSEVFFVCFFKLLLFLKTFLGFLWLMWLEIPNKACPFGLWEFVMKPVYTQYMHIVWHHAKEVEIALQWVSYQ